MVADGLMGRTALPDETQVELERLNKEVKNLNAESQWENTT